MTLTSKISDQRAIILMGQGGVGKTTCSLGIALAAAKQGRNVALLSIDPAKRLAAAIGLDIGHTCKKINLPSCFKGSLDASMLDPKKTFDSMVNKHTPSTQVAEKILKHELYIAASSKLSGSLEYMALARFQEMIENTKYDLVILDTPPDVQALDFLSRPDILTNFQDKGVMKWLIKPFYFANKIGLLRIVDKGGVMGGMAQITGLKALKTLSEFLILIQQVIGGFHRASHRVAKTLHQPHTAFFLVSSPTPASHRVAKHLSHELGKIGHSIDHVIINRCLEQSLVDEINCAEINSESFLYNLKRRTIIERTIKSSIFSDMKKKFGESLEMTVVPELDHSIQNLDQICQFSDTLNNSNERK